jgi:RNA polymerase sigma-70 factor (ECF subfamily)
MHLLALTRTRDPYEADDLAQETFIQAYRKLGSYDPIYSFEKWLLSICVNLSKNRIRARVRRREDNRPYPEPLAVTFQGQSQDMLDLMTALHRIPEKLRVPLVLKHVEGFSYDEIAGILKIGASAAKMRVKRGRDQLVKNLSPEERRSSLT